MRVTRFFAVVMIVGGMLSVGVNAAVFTIGTGTSTSDSPLTTSYQDARTQAIYLASEIGAAKQLTSLALYVSTLPGQMMNNFTIRLKYTTLSVFDTSSTWEFSGWTTVYQTNQTITTTGWVTFPFTTPFVYNGTGNLMVDISFNNSSSSTNGYCRCTSGTTRAVTNSVNSTNGDPLTWTSRTPTPLLDFSYPNIRLSYNETIISVPDLVGITQAMAQTAITAASLSVGNVTYSFSDSVPEGSVISQSPAGGESVYFGTFVNIVVSLGERYAGSGTTEDPYQIAHPQHVVGLGYTTADYDKYFIMMTDIDMGGQIFTKAIIAPDVDDSTSGFQGTTFTGVFDGNNHKITNFSIQGGEHICLGLFGNLNTNSQIKNLGLENYTIQSSNNSSNIGGLVGIGRYCTITNCYTTGNISTSEGAVYTGGLAGFMMYSTITNCYSTGNITAGSNVGGFIGYAFRSTLEKCRAFGQIAGKGGIGGLVGYCNGYTIVDCYSIGNVAAQNYGGGLLGSADNTSITRCYTTSDVACTLSGGSGFGGLLGVCASITFVNCYALGDVTSPHDGAYYGGFIGRSAQSNNLSNCFAIGNVTTTGTANEYSGGFVGVNAYSSQISNCYSLGNVCSSGSNDQYIGGFAGWNDNSSMISKCYSVGNVVGHNYVGGFAGVASTTNIQGSFWDIQTSGQGNGIGTGIASGVTGKAMAEMKTLSTFASAGWDLATIWAICEGTNYPRLRWQIPAGDFGCPEGVGVEDLSALSACWLETVQVKADIDNNDAVDFGDVLLISQNWLLVGCVACNGADISGDGDVNELDLIPMTEQWLMIENVGCRVGDLNTDGRVDMGDWAVFAGNWMEGV